MADKFSLPKQKSAVFWPVGTGDSATLVLRPDKIVMQIDLHHLAKSDNKDETEWQIVDHLVKALPKIDGKPYLAVFALTHPDQDHCKGFAELLKRVHIGELWHTPKIFRDHDDDGDTICQDAKAFRNEAHRRRKYILQNKEVPSGHRLRVIGRDEILNEEKYKGLPDTAKSRAGETVTLADGVELKGDFEAFIHAPFSDDQESDKNDTSLALNVVLYDGEAKAQLAFFGDRAYETVKRIFEVTEYNEDHVEYLYWDVMLAPHHCSKKVMYLKDENDKNILQQDIMDLFEKYARPGAHIISSSASDFTDVAGHNPPHLRARRQYEKIVEAGCFICTHENPSKSSPTPTVFLMSAEGLKLEEARTVTEVAKGLLTAAQVARGSTQPPSVQVGFGQRGQT